jgi:hypothetical protein
MNLRGPNDVREVHDDAVRALDALLHAMLPGATVNHAFDATRMAAMRAGGPPVWSVGIASHPAGFHQLLTYGLSRGIDPSQRFDFELTMRVRSPGAPPMWPVFLLRSLARYQLLEREIAPGEHIDLGGPISHAAMRPEDRAHMPTTRLTTVVVLPGFAQPTPRGSIEIRSVYGLDSAGQELLQACAPDVFCAELRRFDPTLTIDLDGPTPADHPMFRANLGVTRAPSIAPAPAPSAPPPTSAKQRYIHFACTCGAKYATPAAKMPTTKFRIACQSCKAVIVVPEEGRIVNDASFPLVGVPPKT